MKYVLTALDFGITVTGATHALAPGLIGHDIRVPCMAWSELWVITVAPFDYY